MENFLSGHSKFSLVSLPNSSMVLASFVNDFFARPFREAWVPSLGQTLHWTMLSKQAVGWEVKGAMAPASGCLLCREIKAAGKRKTQPASAKPGPPVNPECVPLSEP